MNRSLLHFETGRQLRARPTGLYGWIQSNDGRSAGLFVAFSLAVQLAAALALFLPLTILDPAHSPVFGLGGYFLRYAPAVLLASVMWFAWSMFWHVESVRRAVGFIFVDDTDEPRLCAIIEPLIVAMGLPVPFVGIVESPARNAFACGIGRKKAVVVVTRGLVDTLDDEELGCVLAHELSHIKHGDIRLMAAANICMSALTRLHAHNPLRFTPIHVVLAIGIPAILPLTLLGGFLGQLALRGGRVSRLIIASSREFIADAEAALLTRNPAALASALTKVEYNYRLDTGRQEDDAMMIAGDTEGADATHPTIAARIAALARTTGSMVFNSPGAITEERWAVEPSLVEARSAAARHALPASRVLSRARDTGGENILGLDFIKGLMAMVTIVVLVVIHFDELGQPAIMAAKFDLRPVAMILGRPRGCSIFTSQFRGPQACNMLSDRDAIEAYQGQENTLIGWIGEATRRRRGSGVVDATPTDALFNVSQCVPKPSEKERKLHNC